MTSNAPDLDELLDIALGAARAAGAFLLEDRPRDLGVAATKSSPHDVVTEMDTAAEKLITEYIHARRPGDGLLGEEGSDDPGTTGVRWVVDPIDGTVNYLYNQPAWCVSIAAVDAEGSLVGVVEVPRLGETYQAVRGGGAYLNGERIHCRPAPPLESALVATGFGYTVERRIRQAAVVNTVLAEVRDIRRLGSAAIDLCLVAAGRVDGYFERGLNPWDRDAGVLVAEEAGALWGVHSPEADGSDLTIAAPPGLYETLVERVTSLGA